ncbi:hypothetical protein SEA_TEMPO_4 [Microbacterium phage Tempo]|nr:hypothetical protein SEA_TEMPO_4 [Microbacterium phage Tempo]
MKFTLGFLAGIGTAWAALAIWQRLPLPVGDWDEPGPVPYNLERETVPTSELIDVDQPPTRTYPGFELPEHQRYYLFSTDACPNADHPFSARCGLCGFKRGEEQVPAPVTDPDAFEETGR